MKLIYYEMPIINFNAVIRKPGKEDASTLQFNNGKIGRNTINKANTTIRNKTYKEGSWTYK